MAGFTFKLDPEILDEALEHERRPVPDGVRESPERTGSHEDTQASLPIDSEEHVTVAQAVEAAEAAQFPTAKDGVAAGWAGDVAASWARIDADRVEAECPLHGTGVDQASTLADEQVPLKSEKDEGVAVDPAARSPAWQDETVVGWAGDVAASWARLEADRADAERRAAAEAEESAAADQARAVVEEQQRVHKENEAKVAASLARLEAERVEKQRRAEMEAERRFQDNVESNWVAICKWRAAKEQARLLAEEEKLARERAAEAARQTQLADETVEKYRKDAERAIASVAMQRELATKSDQESVGKTLDKEVMGCHSAPDLTPIVTAPNQPWTPQASSCDGAAHLPVIPNPQIGVAKPPSVEVFSFPKTTSSPNANEGDTTLAATLDRPKILGSAFTQRTDGGSCPSLSTP
jgi:hypothetical protein